MSQKKGVPQVITPATEFEWSAREPLFWLSIAKNLRVSSDVLWRSSKSRNRAMDKKIAKFKAGTPVKFKRFAIALLWPGSAMLMGLAFENLLKAIVVVHEPNVATPDKIDWGKDGHDLVHLAGRSRYTFTPAETDLLGLLHEYVLWMGRYHMPKRVVDSNGMRPFPPRTRAQAVRLFDRLYDHAEQLMLNTLTVRYPED